MCCEIFYCMDCSDLGYEVYKYFLFSSHLQFTIYKDSIILLYWTNDDNKPNNRNLL